MGEVTTTSVPLRLYRGGYFIEMRDWDGPNSVGRPVWRWEVEDARRSIQETAQILNIPDTSDLHDFKREGCSYIGPWGVSLETATCPGCQLELEERTLKTITDRLME